MVVNERIRMFFLKYMEMCERNMMRKREIYAIFPAVEAVGEKNRSR